MCIDEIQKGHWTVQLDVYNPEEHGDYPEHDEDEPIFILGNSTLDDGSPLHLFISEFAVFDRGEFEVESADLILPCVYCEEDCSIMFRGISIYRRGHVECLEEVLEVCRILANRNESITVSYLV